MREYFKYLWERYVRGCKNVGYGLCRWACPAAKRMILIDEGMCWACYEDYCDKYK